MSTKTNLSKAEIAARIPWGLLVDRIFLTLDVDASGFISLNELRSSVAAAALLPHWDEMDRSLGSAKYPNSRVKHRKDGHVDRKEFGQWMNWTFSNTFKGDDKKMRTFCAGIVYDAGINVTDLWESVGSATRDDIASRIPWQNALRIIWRSLDNDASGYLSKEELKYSNLKDQLLPHWDELDRIVGSSKYPKSRLKHRRDGHVDYHEWTAWFDHIFKSECESDDAKMRYFCAGLLFNGGIDVSEAWFAEGSMVADDFASVSWKKVVDLIFVTVDVDCNGYISKHEIATSCVADALLPHLGEFEVYANRRDGKVDRVEWDQWWAETIFLKKFGGDNAKMGRYVGKVCVDAGIDVSSILSEDDKQHIIEAAIARSKRSVSPWIFAGLVVLIAGVSVAAYRRARA